MSSAALAGTAAMAATTSAPNTDATRLLCMISNPRCRFCRPRRTDRRAGRRERGACPAGIVTALPGLSASRGAELAPEPRFAPAHDDVVIPGEHRAQHRREQALPRFCDVDDPLVTHLRGRAVAGQGPTAEAGQLAPR